MGRLEGKPRESAPAAGSATSAADEGGVESDFGHEIE